MTPIELVESDEEDRRDRTRSSIDRASLGTQAVEGLYGDPQHEVGHQPAERTETFYGEPQHEELAECRWGEPFPWLLEADEDRRPADEDRPKSRSRTELPLRRLGRD